MASVLPHEFNSPIFSTLSDDNNLAVSVGEEGRLVVIDVPPDLMPPMFHFRRVNGPIPDNAYYEITFHDLNTLLQENHVVAIAGAPAHHWIISHQSEQGAFTILNLPIWPSIGWNANTNRTIGTRVWELPPYPKEMLFRILARGA